jgi:hypothetical protein
MSDRPRVDAGTVSTPGPRSIDETPNGRYAAPKNGAPKEKTPPSAPTNQ